MRRYYLGVVSCLAAAILLLSSPAFAQRATATLRGTVTDASKGVVPGATVTVTNEDTGLTRSLVTNESGVYVASDLPIGLYRVVVELAGFKTATRTEIRLRVADDYLTDFTLETGELSEVITVAASSTPVKMLGGDVSGVITGQQVRELPLNGRNFIQLATLMPGVSTADGFNVKDKGLTTGSDMSVSGSDVTGNMWTVDGANNNDVGSNRTILIYPSLEAIDEFKILRNSYGPEFGGAGGGQINIVTRGGTNLFRGTAFYSVRNDAFNAKNYFLEQADQPKDQLTRNDFGGSLGGPIIRDKLHFFGSVEWNREDRGIARTAFVPTEAERRGDFSGPRIAGCSAPIPVDPLTGQPFPNNRIPDNRLNTAGQLYLNLYPLPNVTPPTGSCNNWVTSLTSPLNWGQYNARVDWTLSDSTRIMVRYTQDSWTNDAPSAYGSGLWGDDPFPAVDSNWDQPSRSFAAQLSQTLGSSATNTLQFSYSANKIGITLGGTNPDLNSEILAAMPSIIPTESKLYGAGSAHPVWWGGSGYGTLWTEAPFKNNQDLYVIRDDYTKVFGKHLMKAGVLYSTNKKNEDTLGPEKYWSFWGDGVGLNGAWGQTTGNVLANFLLKDMTFGFTDYAAARSAPQRWQDLEMYVADSWQLTPRLTFDYGFRYSIFYNMTWADNKATSFQPDLYSKALGADACNGVLIPPDTNWCADANAKGGTAGPNKSLMNQDYNNIAPRLGVAYDLSGNGRTAIRAGLGQFYQRERLSPGLGLAGNPPFGSALAGVRYLDSTREPYPGAFSRALGTPNVGRELDQKTPYNWQWNLMFQHEIWRNSTIELGYVGNYGYNQLKVTNINQVANGDIDGNGVDDRIDFATLPGGGNGAYLRPYGVLGDKQLSLWDHSGRTQYHSLQTQFISRFGRGSQFQTSYTLARSRANYTMSQSGGLGIDAPLDNANRDLDWGRPEVGRTHIFNASLVWLLPSLEDKSAVQRAFLGDWEIAAIVGAASGQPFTAYAGGVTGLNNGPSGTGFTDNQRPNRTSASCQADGGLPEQIINPAAYTLNGFQVGSIGSAERGDCTGPNYFQTDMGFYKNFPITERMRIQFRWDIFNLFNNTNFVFGSMVSALNVSSATLSADRRTIVSATPAGNFGQAQRTRDTRQMQFQIKLLW